MRHRAAPVFPWARVKLFQNVDYFTGKAGAHLRGTCEGHCEDKFSEEERYFL